MFAPPPNQADYTTFLRTVVGISTGVLPDNADIIPTSLQIALDTVNETLCLMSASLYVLAVYNLATDRLVNFAPDQQGQSFFADKRKDLRLLDISVGVPTAISDQGTSVGVLNTEAMKTLTLQNLQLLKTPWGRRYMEIAQTYGPTIWGAS